MRKLNIQLFIIFISIGYGSLSLRAQSPSTAAPTPSARSASKVISIFCGAYTDIAGTNFSPYWNQLTQVSTVNIQNNPTLKFENFNYQGFELASEINALPMTHLHLDVWTANEISIAISPVSRSATNENVALNPIVKNEWKSYDIELESVAAKWKSISDIYQFFFQGAGGHAVYIDNIYFYNAMEGEDTEAPTGFTATTGLVSFK